MSGIAMTNSTLVRVFQTSKFKRSVLLIACIIFAQASLASGNEVQNDDEVETGKVAWVTDLELAKKKSKETGRPMFLLFQEIPG